MPDRGMIGTKVPQVSDINELAQTIIAVVKVIKTQLIGHKGMTLKLVTKNSQCMN